MQVFRPPQIFVLIICYCMNDRVTRAQDYDTSDMDFIESYDEVAKKVACDALAVKDGAQMKIVLNRYATYEEITKLAFWNLKNDFKNNKLQFDSDIKWKRDLVDTIYNIFKMSCPSEYAPHEYMNIFRELAMIYINSDTDYRTSNNTQAWEHMQKMLMECESSITEPYNVVVQALKITGVTGKSGNVSESADLYPPEEKVDAVFENIDMVVDNLWFVFSHAIGRCYSTLPTQAITVPKLRALFIRDILKPLKNRWGDPGPVQEFGAIVGNFDINRVQRNIRYCVTASYFLNGIAEIQMVRPLRVGYVHEGTNSVQNRKTGATIG